MFTLPAENWKRTIHPSTLKSSSSVSEASSWLPFKCYFHSAHYELRCIYSRFSVRMHRPPSHQVPSLHLVRGKRIELVCENGKSSSAAHLEPMCWCTCFRGFCRVAPSTTLWSESSSGREGAAGKEIIPLSRWKNVGEQKGERKACLMNLKGFFFNSLHHCKLRVMLEDLGALSKNKQGTGCEILNLQRLRCKLALKSLSARLKCDFFKVPLQNHFFCIDAHLEINLGRMLSFWLTF